MRTGDLRQLVSLQTPGPDVADTDGGYTQSWPDLAAHIYAEVKPATARDLERSVSSTVQSTASHLVTTRYLPGVTTKTRVVFHDGATDRILAVTGVFDPEERHRELVLACVEQVA